MGFDVIIIGAGHNGLVTAAYLAQAGRRVLVLERRELVGGCAVTEEDYQPAVRSSRVPRFDVQTFAERGQRRFDLIRRDWCWSENKRSMWVLGIPIRRANSAFFRPLCW